MMKRILKEISQKAIELEGIDFVQNQWLGFEPASETEIAQTEKRLEIQLPNDYKTFLSITNGFYAPTQVDPTFHSVTEIDLLKNIDTYIIKEYSLKGMDHIGDQLERSIIIAGIGEEQYFLLIPPTLSENKWKYWKFAEWLPGEDEFESLEHYFEDLLDFMAEMDK